MNPEGNRKAQDDRADSTFRAKPVVRARGVKEREGAETPSLLLSNIHLPFDR